MKTEEIEGLIADFEGEIRAEEECPHATDGYISTHTAIRAAKALRFLLEERKNLVQATAAKDLTPNGQLHAVPTVKRSETTSVAVYWPGEGYGCGKECRNPEEVEAEVQELRRGGYGKGKAGRIHVVRRVIETQDRSDAPPERQVDRPELPNDLLSRETKTGENP